MMLLLLAFWLGVIVGGGLVYGAAYNQIGRLESFYQGAIKRLEQKLDLFRKDINKKAIEIDSLKAALRRNA